MRDVGMVALLYAAEEQCIEWNERGIPTLIIASDGITAKTLRPHRPTIAAVLRRAMVFRQQLQAPGHPFLQYRPARRRSAKVCASCGGRLRAYESLSRCDLCEAGKEVAMAGLHLGRLVEGSG